VWCCLVVIPPPVVIEHLSSWCCIRQPCTTNSHESQRVCPCLFPHDHPSVVTPPRTYQMSLSCRLKSAVEAGDTPLEDR
jgi:hypothetical protein